MQSWELIVSPTESYLYNGIMPQDPEAKYVEVVPKAHLVTALLALERIKKLVQLHQHRRPMEFKDLCKVEDLCNLGLADFDKHKVFLGRAHYDAIPWADVSKWKAGFWYPLPIGSNWTESMLYVVEGYDLFYQDPESPEDCIPVGTPTMSFKEACDTCENHNKEVLPGLHK